eukprot:3033215-Alexandrium_andersonii.AAC.1
MTSIGACVAFLRPQPTLLIVCPVEPITLPWTPWSPCELSFRLEAGCRASCGASVSYTHLTLPTICSV